MECQVDAVNANPDNGTGAADGYAKTDVLDAEAFSEAAPEKSLADVTWGDEPYTFYSAHYMDYVNDPGTNRPDAHGNCPECHHEPDRSQYRYRFWHPRVQRELVGPGVQLAGASSTASYKT